MSPDPKYWFVDLKSWIRSKPQFHSACGMHEGASQVSVNPSSALYAVVVCSAVHFLYYMYFNILYNIQNLLMELYAVSLSVIITAKL